MQNWRISIPSELLLMAHIHPPFTASTALEKVKFAQKAWNSKDPDVIVKGTDTMGRRRFNVM